MLSAAAAFYTDDSDQRAKKRFLEFKIATWSLNDRYDMNTNVSTNAYFLTL